MSKFGFKNSGKKVNNYIKSEEYLEKIKKQDIRPFGIVLPIRKKTKSTESLFSMTYTAEDQLLVDLKTLVLTRKGEYLANPNFGTNIISIYNRTDIEDANDIVMNEVQEAVSNYLPAISLQNFESAKFKNNETDSEYYKVIIDYTIPVLSSKSYQLILNIATSR
jgi:phage baseplate assembly protein W